MTAFMLAAAWVAAVLAAGWRARPLDLDIAVLRAGVAPDQATEGLGRRWRDPPSRAPTRRRVRRDQTGGVDAASRRRPRHVAVSAALVVVGLVVGSPFLAIVLAVAAAVVRDYRWRRAERQRTADRLAELPGAIDLLAIALAAGLTPRQGIRLLGERGPSRLRAAFSDVQARLDGGEPLVDALARLITHLGEPSRGLVRAITVAERDGVPLRTLLGSLADEARRQRRHDLEASIRKLPVRLAFPLACCVLPAFVVLTVVPLLAGGLSRLGPIGP
jgi:tight adherence protein C